MSTDHDRILSWFKRRCGNWRSERRYLFSTDGQPKLFTTMMDIKQGEKETQFDIQWEGSTSGVMAVELRGTVLHRSRDYFGDGANSSEVFLIDPDTVVTSTAYGGVRYREEIRFLNQDGIAFRQTLGTKEDGSFALCGQYVEFRLPYS